MPDDQRKRCSLPLSWWRIIHFLFTKGHFSFSAASSWSDWEPYLLELIIWFFLKGAYNRGLLSNLFIYTTTLLVEDQSLVWLVVILFTCPEVSLVPCCCTVYPLFITITICFKNKMLKKKNCFPLRNKWKWIKKEFFSLNLCKMKTSKQLT